MGSPSGASLGLSLLQTSTSEEDLMDQRKRKRMISNRESARRSRMRKHKHLDDLTAQVARLRRENNQIISSISVTTQQLLSVEGENSVLRAQVGELSNRLESLNEIISFLSGSSNGYFGNNEESFIGDGLSNSWNYGYLNEPIMASADMLLQY